MIGEILPVYKRELKSYFTSPAIYVVLGLFLGITGLLFNDVLHFFLKLSQQKTMAGQQTMPINLTQIVIGSLFWLVHLVMLFAIPIITMRLFSEEKRLGTFELLVTCPLRDWSILLGKYLAALTVGWLALAICLVYPVTVQALSGGQVENKVIAVVFLGLALVIAGYVAFGLFASSVTENQMLSAILTFVGLLGMFLLGRMNSVGEGKTVFGVPLDKLLQHISVGSHLEDFGQGVINLIDVVYFALIIAFFLTITSKILEARRWRV